MACTLSLVPVDQPEDPHVDWLRAISYLGEVIDQVESDEERATLAHTFSDLCSNAISTKPTTPKGALALIEILKLSEATGDSEHVETVLNGVLEVLNEADALGSDIVHQDSNVQVACPAEPEAGIDPHMAWEAERRQVAAEHAALDDQAEGYQELDDELCQRERDLLEKIQSTPAKTIEGSLCQIAALDQFEIDLGEPYRNPGEIAARQGAVATIRRNLGINAKMAA